MYEVRVDGLRFRGFHGVFESERASGNEFRATILALVDGSADATDRLADTVDYSTLAGLLLKVSEASSFKTVERLAAAYATEVLDRFPLVTSVEVRIDKFSPPMDADVDSCGVRLRLDRE